MWQALSAPKRTLPSTYRTENASLGTELEKPCAPSGYNSESCANHRTPAPSITPTGSKPAAMLLTACWNTRITLAKHWLTLDSFKALDNRTHHGAHSLSFLWLSSMATDLEYSPVFLDLHSSPKQKASLCELCTSLKSLIEVFIFSLLSLAQFSDFTMLPIWLFTKLLLKGKLPCLLIGNN